MVDALATVAHELSNHLNQIVLQADILAMLAPAELKPEATPIRREAMAAAELLRNLQQARSLKRPERSAVDLNEAARLAAQEWIEATGGRITVEPAGGPVLVTAHPDELVRIVGWLLRREEEGPRRAWTLRVRPAGEEALMVLSDAGGPLRAWTGAPAGPIEEWAVETLLRRTGGRQVLEAGNTRLVLSWPGAQTG